MHGAVKRVCYNLYAAFQDKQLACMLCTGEERENKVRGRPEIQSQKNTGKNTQKQKKETMQEFKISPKWRLLGAVGGQYIHIRDRAGGHWFH